MSLYANHFGLESVDLIDIKNFQLSYEKKRSQTDVAENIFPAERNVAHSKWHHKNSLLIHT